MFNFITWTADPVLFTIGPREIRWYGLMFAIGFWVGLEIVKRVFKNEGEKSEWVDSLFIYTIVGTILGARLGHCLFYGFDYYMANPIEILYIWEGGLASHGGTAGIFLAILIYSKRVTHRNPLWTFDRVVLPVGLVAALIRIGNLFNHEIYGHETSYPWGFRFIENINQWRMGAEPIFTVPSHPTQLYEAACYLITFAIVMTMYWGFKLYRRQGLIFGVFFLGIFGSRFFLEFIKNNQEAFEDGMLINMGQILSIPFVIYALYLIIHALRSPETEYDKKTNKPVVIKQ